MLAGSSETKMGRLRFFKILLVAIKYRLDRLIPPQRLPLWARVLLAPLKLVPAPKSSPAAAIRLTFEELGPVFVKFGQILSTRRDLFEGDVADELQKLQDQVPPFPGDEARTLIEASLEAPITELFDDFDETPLASASVAQVHTAKLKTGEEIVVKIIRPGIDKTIRQDIDLMYRLARILLVVWGDAKRLHPVEIVKDYERTILDELNLQLEAANTNKLRENWLDSGKLYVPKVYFDYCRQNVMVIERIYGVSSAKIEELRASGVNMQKLAHLGVEIFFTQVFEDNFFHADMHPGNVFIDATDRENPTYIGLDCAIIGSLTEDDKSYLARNLLAFFHQDYYEVARLHVESGWVPMDTDIREFESVIRSVCEPIFQKPISEISFGRVLLSLFQTARRFDMEVQPQLVLLQKTLLNIEGMGRQIYPELDLWQTAAPYMEDWMRERMGFAGLLRQFSANAPQLIAQLPEVPKLAINALNEIQKLGEHNRQQTRMLGELNRTLIEQSKNRRYSRLGGYALIVALFGTFLPMSGMASQSDALIGASVLGSLGVYWMFIKP
ncbi:MAG: ubiquinone biosynthesis protein [Patiriisocius sp.]|jgi:ubiquinone biosynthesis protein